jgi:Transglutaminase-like superfamily
MMPTARSVRAFFVAAFIVFVSCNFKTASCAEAANRTWFTLSFDDKRSGYAYTESIATKSGNLEREVVTVDIRQFGRRSRLERTTELLRDDRGTSIEIRFESSAGTEHVTWRAAIENGQLRIHATGNSSREQLKTLPDGIEFFAALHLLPQFKTNARWPLQLQLFDPAHQAPIAITATLSDAMQSSDEKHIHLSTDNDGDTAIEDIWIGADGTVRSLVTPAFGTLLRWNACFHDCDRRVADPFDPMDHLAVRSPVRIPSAAVHHTLRFVISRADGRTPLLVETGEQSVAIDGNRAVVTVCDACGIDEHPTPDILTRYLTANRWVRSDNEEIRNLALNSVSRSMRIDLRMEKLTQLVEKRMRGTNDMMGYADALQALHTGSGDCTEFAVLLAALARADGIPTRLVTGLAYSSRFSGKKDVFSPHMWVQAWNGERWKSFDAALAQFDSSHIALAISDGEPDNVAREFAQLPQLRIEKAGVVRQP